jgi:serine/threonine-protein phosphatase with EF-hand domain
MGNCSQSGDNQKKLSDNKKPTEYSASSPPKNSPNNNSPSKNNSANAKPTASPDKMNQNGNSSSNAPSNGNSSLPVAPSNTAGGHHHPLPPIPPPSGNTAIATGSSSSPAASLASPHVEEEVKKVLAISKIQKQARRKNALKAAQAEIQWKLFADLDTHDEAEMLSLAVFMQTLLDIIPTSTTAADSLVITKNLEKNGLPPVFTKIKRETTLKELNKSEDEMDVVVPTTTTTTTTTEQDDDEEDRHFIKLNSINFNPIAGSKRMNSMILTKENDFDFCHMNINSHLVTLVIEAFRNGKKLSKPSVIKVLRRVYKSFLKQPNITRITVESQSKVTVVGDLHGQLTDLLFILDSCGLPNENNKFIFNGDFVDRGHSGFEVVFLIFLLYVVYGPTIIGLNRGNHEDASVCRVYGFEEEVLRKYDELMFEMFAELFNNLPLFSLINNTIFIVHGGLFHEPKVTLAELEQITRTDYFVKPPIPYPENLNGLTNEQCYSEYLKQLQRDALWSDPIAENGCYLNHRGAGIVFGPNIAKEFMNLNSLSMIIRSHECVYRGFELPFSPISLHESFHQNINTDIMSLLEQKLPTLESDSKNTTTTTDELPFLCTLFSASNYTNGDNFGAFIQFSPHSFHLSKAINSKDTNTLYYIVKKYRTTAAAAEKTIIESNKVSLKEMILKKKSALVSAFEAMDEKNIGTISRLEWAEVMQRVTMIKILWLSILPTIVPEHCLTSPNTVNYRFFLESYTEHKGGTVSPPITGNENTSNIVDDLYGQRKQLETVFYFFDTNGDGVSLDAVIFFFCFFFFLLSLLFLCFLFSRFVGYFCGRI